ncbi:hypothetical protein EMMF5_006210 [Cystobasidiomycetes sp. EMM_F5]
MSRDELIAVFGREVLLPESTEPLLNLARANVTVELGRRGGVKRVLIPNAVRGLMYPANDLNQALKVRRLP